MQRDAVLNSSDPLVSLIFSAFDVWIINKAAAARTCTRKDARVRKKTFSHSSSWSD